MALVLRPPGAPAARPEPLKATALSAPSAGGYVRVRFHGGSREAPARMAAGVAAPAAGSIVRVEMAGTLPLVVGRLT